MARAFFLTRSTLVLSAVLAASGAASAGGPASAGGDTGSRSGGTFGMVTATQSTGARVTASAAGASVAPKAVVRNPYNVPLLQNAGSLRVGR